MRHAIPLFLLVSCAPPPIAHRIAVRTYYEPNACNGGGYVVKVCDVRLDTNELRNCWEGPIVDRPMCAP